MIPTDVDQTRQKLEEITSSNPSPNGKDYEAQLWEQASKIEQIIGITCTQTLFDGDPSPRLGLQVNCHAYTLGAWKHPNYFELNTFIERIAKGTFAANSGLFEVLIQKNIIARTDEPANGNIVLYLNGNRVKHSGIILNASTDPIIILSKWGVLPIFAHNLYHVPANYGNPQFYSRFEDNDVVKLFDAYYFYWQEVIEELEQKGFVGFLKIEELKQALSIIVDEAGITLNE